MSSNWEGIRYANEQTNIPVIRKQREDKERERERVHERIGKESGTGSSIILIQTPLLGP